MDIHLLTELFLLQVRVILKYSLEYLILVPALNMLLQLQIRKKENGIRFSELNF